MKSSEDLLFKDIKKQIDSSFVKDGWVTVYFFSCKNNSIDVSGIYSTIVDESEVGELLKDYSWDIRIGVCGIPVLKSSYSDGIEKMDYCRFDEFEPLVYPRSFKSKEWGLELSEEFRLYYNLYENYKSPYEKEYLYANTNGDEEIVAEIKKYNIRLKLSFLEDYISVRKKDFLIYFDFMRFSDKTISDLGMHHIGENYSSEKYFYRHLIESCDDGNYKTRSWITGKVLIKNINNYKSIQ
jgi:hypothetical protein